MNIAFDTLDPLVVSGIPRPGTKAYEALSEEVRRWIAGAQTVAKRAECDLQAGDLEAALELMRSANRAIEARRARIDCICCQEEDGIPKRTRILALAARFAPAVAVASAVAVALMDLYDVGAWHHHAWGVPAAAAIVKPLIAKWSLA